MTTAMAVLALLAAAPQDAKRIEELELRVRQLEKKIEGMEQFLMKILTEGLPAVQESMKGALARAKETSCANNLSQLWKLQMVYMAQFGGRAKSMPAETGPAFWLALSKTEPPLIDAEVLEIYVCPATSEKPRAGFTSYRGPAKKVQELREDDVVGCCEPGNHPGGSICVLLKNGSVQVVKPENALYKKAVEGTVGAKK
jgi:hypothetical protein